MSTNSVTFFSSCNFVILLEYLKLMLLDSGNKRYYVLSVYIKVRKNPLKLFKHVQINTRKPIKYV